MSLAFFYFIWIDEPLYGVGFLVVDVIHTIVVTFMLLVGAYRDGNGNIVAYPGQFKTSDPQT